MLFGDMLHSYALLLKRFSKRGRTHDGFFGNTTNRRGFICGEAKTKDDHRSEKCGRDAC